MTPPSGRCARPGHLAADCDAVHLTVVGYLTTATRVLPLDETTATMLAGWNPDQTWWLTDILVSSSADPDWWHNPDDDPAEPDFAWRREAG